MFSTKKIKFYSKHFSLIEKPIPAKKKIPNWYKLMENYPAGKVQGGSVKKCVPFMDALTSGYYIVNNFAVHVSWKDEKVFFHYNQNLENGFAYEVNSGIKDHLPWQVSKDFFYHDEIPHVFKMDNPWSIKTPKGYSCLFSNPPNTNSPIRIPEAIVDTDNYEAPVNLPFLMKNFKEEIILPAGLPIAWIMPFKRDSWKMEIYDYDIDTTEKHVSLFREFLDNYKNKIWNKKKYD